MLPPSSLVPESVLAQHPHIMWETRNEENSALAALCYISPDLCYLK